MTTITEINGCDITKSPKTLAKASDTIKAVTDRHNAACGIKIVSRIADAGNVQVSIATAKGRAKKWLYCHLLTNVQSFADGVADTAKHAPTGEPAPVREFVAHTDESAYFHGTIHAIRMIAQTQGA